MNIANAVYSSENTSETRYDGRTDIRAESTVEVPLPEAVLFHNRISQLEAQIADGRYQALERKLAEAEKEIEKLMSKVCTH